MSNGNLHFIVGCAILVCAILSLCCRSVALGEESSPSTAQVRPRHVFIVVLENQGFETTFGKNSPAPYLSRELAPKGLLLRRYYGIGHFSLDNYIAMVSGQGPNPYTQNDCLTYYDFRPLVNELDRHGQALGAGCVYPEAVRTLANQLDDKRLTWKGYMEDMGVELRAPSPRTIR